IRKLLLVFLGDMLITTGARSPRGRILRKLRGRRAVAVVMRDDDDVDLRPETANVVAHAVDVRRIDRDAIARADFCHTGVRVGRDLLAVLIPARRVLQESDLDALTSE